MNPAEACLSCLALSFAHLPSRLVTSNGVPLVLQPPAVHGLSVTGLRDQAQAQPSAAMPVACSGSAPAALQAACAGQRRSGRSWRRSWWRASAGWGACRRLRWCPCSTSAAQTRPCSCSAPPMSGVRSAPPSQCPRPAPQCSQDAVDTLPEGISLDSQQLLL